MAILQRVKRPNLEVNGFDSPARGTLAHAIAARDAADVEVERCRTLEDTLRDRRRDLEGAVDAAKLALADSKRVASQALLDEIRPSTAVSAATCRASLNEALDAYETMNAACVAIPGRIAAAEAARSTAVVAVINAALDVMREHPDVPEIFARIEAAQREYLRLSGIMDALTGLKVYSAETDWGSRADTAEADLVRAADYNAQQSPRNWKFITGPAPDKYHNSPEDRAGALIQVAAQPWYDAYSALLKNASAALPSAI